MNIHKSLSLALQVTLLIGAVLSAFQQRWMVALITTAIVGVTFLPLVLGRRFDVFIPPEFEVLTVVFVYASLFLGEVRGYYVRFWWWDAVLHTGSGFLLGILGFLLVYVLNERSDIDLHMQPRFVALFAFMFSVGMGALWEIFEFGMDQVFGLNMQKSGLVDTMWDLIVDSIGALAIALLGWSYLSTAGSNSFLERWIGNFIRENPRLFKVNGDGK
ncbi:MAG: hypothetical protein R3192_10720 [Woeseiaceae bacterium]|nr:hypothetical protein [Woeseiaceae bacterium]